MNYEFGHRIRIEVRFIYRFFIIGIQQLAIGWILFGVQYESCIDDTSWQWEYIERSVN